MTNSQSKPPDEQQHDDTGKDTNDTADQVGDTMAFVPSEESKPVAKPTPASSAKSELPKSVGRYKILSLLGSGAFGAVYLGHDSQLQRNVAVKVPLLEKVQQPKVEIEALFLEEARQLAQLTHPNIVTVFDVGIDDGVCYIVSDFLDGPSLNEWLKDRRPNWQETVRIVAAIADGLAAAHSRSTVHRDIKPQNIIMTERAEGVVPTLVDFGLALSQLSVSSPFARRGAVTGTPTFMSPEQARGEGHRIDGRADIYSLGVTLYLMLCGELPFHSPNLSELLQMVIEDEPRPPRQIVHGIPRELERICLKAMAKQISARYTTAGDMAAELRNLLQQHEAEVQAAQATLKMKERPAKREGAQILVAEDHELTRFKLQTDLKKWGHEVTVAEDGEQAWQLFQQDEFSIVITDWMMPNVDGLELVRRIRSAEQSNYVYIIMLTAKAEKHDIVTGMGAGADDFLGKPFHRDELQVRLRAGIRITKLNRELNETNQRIRRSKEAAAQIQKTFLPPPIPDIPGFNFAWDNVACDQLGGDMLNIVALDEKHLGLYVLDVTGEGVPAALMATNLSRAMSAPSDAKSMLVERTDDDSGFRILEPVEVAAQLNRRFAETQEGNQYFSLAYGILNLETREYCFTSAGHPPLLLLKCGTSPVMLDLLGFPIGMAPEGEEFSQQTIVLEPSDRLLMYSDGLPDAMNQSGEVFGAARLLESVANLNHLPLPNSVQSLMADIAKWRGAAEANDDMSVLAFEVSAD